MKLTYEWGVRVEDTDYAGIYVQGGPSHDGYWLFDDYGRERWYAARPTRDQIADFAALCRFGN